MNSKIAGCVTQMCRFFDSWLNEIEVSANVARE